MMDKNDKGEHSRKSEAADEEKPLKKARFLWEVKGKSHLKTSSNEVSSALIDDDRASCSNSEDSKIYSESNVRSKSPTRSCCLETFLAKTETIMDRDSSDEDESEKLPLENSIENEIPVTLVSTEPKNQDYYLRKWQARQIARGFVDNTINSMLENWVDRPFDAANFVEDFENDGQVEDDAILMAIQSHGLQSGWRGDSDSSVYSASSFISNVAVAGSSRCDSPVESLGSNSVFPESAADNLQNLRKEQENESSSSSVSVDTTSSISNHYEGDLGDPMDFLNAAVSVAIQKKGLTYG